MMVSMSRRPALSGLVFLGLVVFGVIVWVFTDRGERPLDEGLGRVASEFEAGPGRTTDIDAPVVHGAGEQGVVPFAAEDGRELVAAEVRASLELRFVDAASGAPVSGEIDLWRLDVAADTEWTAGDVRIGEAELEEGRAVFPELAVGTYRVEAVMQKRTAESLPAFEVVEGPNVRTFEVEPAGMRDVQLEVLGVDGVRFAGRVEFFDKGTTMSFRGAREPVWAEPRRLKAPPDEHLIGMAGAGGGYYMTSHRSWRERERGERGFVLPRLRESNRERTYVHKWRLRLERVTPVPVQDTWSVAEARAYTGHGEVGYEEPGDGGGGLQELAVRGQRWENALRIEDEGADTYVVVVVDPVDLAWRIEGVEGFSELEVLEGLEVELVAAPTGDVAPKPEAVFTLSLDGEVVLRSRWFPLQEPLPRLIARAPQD